MIHRHSKILIACALLLTSLSSWSLPDDSQQEIRIASDSASLDKAKGEIIYSGNVKMQQGSLNIQAQTLTLIRTVEGLQKIIATGSPARYEQTLNEQEGKTLAYGETIIYNTKIEQLTLLNNAGLEKQGNVFSGEKIVYLIKEQRVKAESPEQQNRIRMVIQPKKDKEP
ncbi:MAG: lipopolysaccharide transport periplasmic protein LptA [Bermanella sp.]|nr:lipopolysaccharide transport periplasmic protein LptA [Bermanella sp.]|tara:strand:+ start:230 stop:736 length:507 start_codon:yes stop_codon:yes gene_type:complete